MATLRRTLFVTACVAGILLAIVQYLEMFRDFQ